MYAAPEAMPEQRPAPEPVAPQAPSAPVAPVGYPDMPDEEDVARELQEAVRSDDAEERTVVAPAPQAVVPRTVVTPAPEERPAAIPRVQSVAITVTGKELAAQMSTSSKSEATPPMAPAREVAVPRPVLKRPIPVKKKPIKKIKSRLSEERPE